MATTELSAALAALFGEWARRLHLAIRGDRAMLLFSARAGLRLRLIYERVAAANGWSPWPAADLMISRLLAARVTLAQAPDLVWDIVAGDFAGHPLAECLGAFGVAADTVAPATLTSAAMLRRFAASAAGAPLLAEAAEQHALFARRLAADVGDAECLAVVDSGQFGSAQLLLEAAYPDYAWRGLYIGRCNHRGAPAPHFARARGLIFQADRWLPRRPETAFLKHWHLLEDLLEPALPSVTRFVANDAGRPLSNLELDPAWPHAVTAGDALWQAVLAGLEAQPAFDLEREHPAYRDALATLEKMILAPRPQQLAALATGRRSRDFGRSGEIPVLLEGHRALRQRLGRINAALWREGQVVSEFGRAGTWLLEGRRRLRALIDRA